MTQQRPQQGRAKAPARRRFATVTEELRSLPALDTENVARVTARHILRRLQLKDDFQTWAKARDVVRETLDLIVPPADGDAK